MKARVLVVGNEDTLLATRKMIVDMKYESVITRPEHALDLLNETQFDLLLLCHSLQAEQATELVEAVYRAHEYIIIIRLSSSRSSLQGDFPIVDRVIGSDPNPREWFGAIKEFLEPAHQPMSEAGL